MGVSAGGMCPHRRSCDRRRIDRTRGLSDAEPRISARDCCADSEVHRNLDSLRARIRRVLGCDAVFVATGTYLVNLIFPIKMYVLLAALIYNFTIHRKVATMENPTPILSKVVAVISLLLWVSVV